MTPIARAPVPAFVESIMRVVGSHQGIDIQWINAVGHANTPRVRNVLCHQALELGADELIWIDDDISFKPEALFQLLAHNVDIVAAAPQRRDLDGTTFCAHLDTPQKTKGTSDVFDNVYNLYAGHAATAFMRVKRGVYDALKSKVDWFHHEKAGDGQVRAYYDYKIGEGPSGTKDYIGEDYYFSQLAKENGYEVWIDPYIQLSHWNNAPMNELMANHIFKVSDNDPSS